LREEDELHAGRVGMKEIVVVDRLPRSGEE
jgi:hypothetical protein